MEPHADQEPTGENPDVGRCFWFGRTVSRVHVANLVLVTAVTPMTDHNRHHQAYRNDDNVLKCRKVQKRPFLGFSRFCFLILRIT